MAEDLPAPPPPPTAPAIPTPPVPSGQSMVRQTDSLAIAALVVGVISVPGAFLVYGVSGIVLGGIAIVLGLVARRRIKESGGSLAGGGLAAAGWILGICGVVFGAALIVILLGLMYAFSQYSKGG